MARRRIWEERAEDIELRRSFSGSLSVFPPPPPIPASTPAPAPASVLKLRSLVLQLFALPAFPASMSISTPIHPFSANIPLHPSHPSALPPSSSRRPNADAKPGARTKISGVGDSRKAAGEGLRMSRRVHWLEVELELAWVEEEKMLREEVGKEKPRKERQRGRRDRSGRWKDMVMGVLRLTISNSSSKYSNLCRRQHDVSCIYEYLFHTDAYGGYQCRSIHVVKFTPEPGYSIHAGTALPHP